MKKLPWMLFISLISSITILISTLGISGCIVIKDEVTNTDDTTPPGALVASPSGGGYCTTSVTLSSDDQEATIYYTLDGSGPTTGSMVYTGPLDIGGDTTLKFMAVDTCGNQSGTVTEVYDIDVEAPTGLAAYPAGGSYCATIVSLSASDGTIYYTLDGSGPTTGSMVYTGPLDIGGDTTLKFMAVDTCGNQSGTVTEVYMIDTVANVTITSPVNGVTVYAGNVTFSGNADTDITTITVTTDQGLTGEPYSSPIVGGNWSVTLIRVNEPLIIITARGMDECGNIGSHSIMLSVLDIAGPEINIISPADGSLVCTNQVVVTGTVSDPSGIDWGTLTITVNGGTPEGVFTNTLTGEWTATFSSAQVVEGSNTLVVSVFDNSCSSNYSSTTRSFMVDTVEPTVVITSPSGGECIYTSTIVVSGIVTDSGSGVASVWVNAITVQVTGENWTATLMDLPNGPLTITATAADLCSNFNSTSVMVNILVNPCGEGSWSGSVNISNSPGFALFPSVAVESPTNLHVVWDDDTTGIIEIYYSGFTGGSWSPTPENISNTPGDSQVPSIAVDSSGDLHVVWDDDTTGTAEIYYSRFTGGSWSPTPENISNNPGESWYPSIAVDSLDNLHVVWQDDTTGIFEIYYSRFTGGSWSPTPENISNTPGNSYYPTIAVDSSGDLHVVWDDDTTGIIEIYYSGFTGGSWSPTPENISNTPGDSLLSSIAVDSSDNLHVVWMDGSTDDIYYKIGKDMCWWPSPINVSNTSGWAEFPCIAVDSNGGLHLVYEVWEATCDIYYNSCQP